MVTVIPWVQALAQETISSQALLIIALLGVVNTALTAIAAYFIRDFVADVRRLTERVVKLERGHAVMKAVLIREIGDYADESDKA